MENMTIMARLKADSLTARKAKDKFTAGILTCLISEAGKIGIDNGHRETTDAEAKKVITKFVKGVKENIELIIKRESPRGIIALEDEYSIYQKYLPKQLTEQETRDIVEPIAKVASNIGAAMSAIKPYSEGIDMKLASKIVREVMNG